MSMFEVWVVFVLLPKLDVLFSVISVISIILIIISFIVVMVGPTINKDFLEEYKRYKRGWSVSRFDHWLDGIRSSRKTYLRNRNVCMWLACRLKTLVMTGLIFTILSICVPNTKQIIAMYVVPLVTQNTELSQIPHNTYKLINKIIQGNYEDLVKEKSK